MKEIGAVVLAAGGSRRLGQPKQLVELQGEPLVRRAVRLASEAGCAPVVVVLGAECERCQTALAGLEVLVAENSAWAEGMAGSLRAGLAALQNFSANATLVLAVDQLRVEAEHLKTLLATADGARIVAAHYGGRLGVPALFPRAYWGELMRLEGDVGARGVLERDREQVVAVEMPEAAVDLDTPEDLLRLGEER